MTSPQPLQDSLGDRYTLDRELGRGGWPRSTWPRTCGTGEATSETDSLALLARIEQTIKTAKNRVRRSMNSALIAIGGRSSARRRGLPREDLGARPA